MSASGRREFFLWFVHPSSELLGMTESFSAVLAVIPVRAAVSPKSDPKH
jgi:hypothetical protein